MSFADADEWEVEDVERWIELNGLDEYVKAAFVTNQVRGGDLLQLDDASLLAMGIAKMGHRKKLLKLFREARLPPAERLKSKSIIASFYLTT